MVTLTFNYINFIVIDDVYAAWGVVTGCIGVMT